MTTNMSFLNLVLNASLIVQLVMLSLLIASIASWSIIFSKNKVIKKIKLSSDEFESAFWKGGSLSDLYQAAKRNNSLNDGISSIFNAGFQAFNRLSSSQSINKNKMIFRTWLCYTNFYLVSSNFGRNFSWYFLLMPYVIIITIELPSKIFSTVIL